MKKRALVVEDHSSTRKAYMARLEFEGFLVSGAPSLHEARKIISKTTFHVALIDLMLIDNDDSNRDGLKLVKEIKKLNEGTKCILLTAKGNTGIVRDAFAEFNTDEYLDKDIDQSSFVTAINNVVENTVLYKMPKNWTEIQIISGGNPSEESKILNFFNGICDYREFLKTLKIAFSNLHPLYCHKKNYANTINELELIIKEFWSKSLGHSIYVAIGSFAKHKDIEAYLKRKDINTIIFKHSNSNLCVFIVDSNGSERCDFENKHEVVI